MKLHLTASLTLLWHLALLGNGGLKLPEMTAIQRPHDNCYWVEPGRFLAGEYPAAVELDVTHQRLSGYLDAGITFFLDLTEEHESSNLGPLRPYETIIKQMAQERGIEVTHQRMPIRDMSIPRTGKEMTVIIDAITTALDQGHNVYVHCWGGIGRTGTVIGCYLIQKGMTGREALNQLGQWWSTVEKSEQYPNSPYTREQRRFVKAYRSNKLK